jgi:hypothetical protein
MSVRNITPESGKKPCLEYQRWDEEKEPPTLQQRSGGRGIFFELPEVAVFDLLHEGFALEDVAVEVGGELAGHDEKLIVRDFGERDGAARGNKMRAPLKYQAGVPESEDGEENASGGEGGPGGAKTFCGAVEENGKAENK